MQKVIDTRETMGIFTKGGSRSVILGPRKVVGDGTLSTGGPQAG